jgi:hypothetical protein
MNRNPLLLILGIGLILPSASLQGQRIKVAVAISDSSAGRVFQGGFSSAFRALGDVDVVSLAEAPEYIISGVVICEPVTCQNPLYYSASLRWYSPFTSSQAYYLAVQLVQPTPSGTLARRMDSVALQIIEPAMRGYERTHQTWVIEWGRERYEQAIRELVRRIDVECLEKSRAYSRLFAERDTATYAALRWSIYSHEWLC